MKTILILTITLLTLSANAGIETIYNCTGGVGKARTSLIVKEVTVYQPGVALTKSFRAVAKASWLGETRQSSEVKVGIIHLNNGGTRFVNSRTQFDVSVIEEKTIDDKMKIRATGSFYDRSTGAKANFIPSVWLSCK